LEICASERYGALDQMSSELRRLQEQQDALDAFVEALRTNDGWLAYHAKALRDQLLELEGQSTEGALLTVDFGTPSYKFTINICTYLIF
jgi:hypothetical protein